MAPPAVVDKAVISGFANAEAYDAHRPSYPAQAVDGLLGHLGIANKPGARIVDLAAGTGKFTELLAARPEVFEILAVEPHEKMRENLEAKRLRGVTTRDGVAAKMDVPDGWADAVIAAQVRHGRGPRRDSPRPQARGLAGHDLERRRLLVSPAPPPAFDPRSGFFSHNRADNQPKNWTPSTRWEAGMKELVVSAPPDGPKRFRDGAWMDVFDRQSSAARPLFTTPIGQDRVPFTVWRTKEALWDRLNTLSHIFVLPDAEKAAFKAKFEQILKGGDGNWNDKQEVEFHGATAYAWTKGL
ncbi:2-heptaprenyl-1,4-naphthoquinone methyltransferase [Drechmeria coniospora]|uniref:2-heptaprenyl-1,4-naphthoquinone methyltransferase n=1 Tax=Drechmeria coniospora TaxID=98403 RepID=A0A151GSF9_DRECN|nr:2-heptaprenyl-1,4-naphthoquinone methyltransferase [Drechmeria coniospora]KYK60001.1 2-heptaprenyl-1,4-naphthoquinone methyltransferase [Drechmeria coniospora]